MLSVVTLGEVMNYSAAQTKTHVARRWSELQRPYLSGSLTLEVLGFDIGRVTTPTLAIAPFDAKQAKAHQAAWAKHLKSEAVLTNSIGMKFALIPPGEFIMGSPETEEAHEKNETQHRVRITKPLYLGRYEVTQEEYEKLIGKNPSWFSAKGTASSSVAGLDTRRCPVEYVSWDEAVEFCEKLSRREGKTYRLPTEAEWEYACRSGTETPFHFGRILNG